MRSLLSRQMILLAVVVLMPPLLLTQAGRKAPSFTLDNLDGKRVTLESVLGKGPVVVTFWATWCKPCLQELGKLKQAMEPYVAQGVTVVAISMDTEKTLARVRPLVASRGYPFMILLDPDGEAARRYYVQSPPFTLVLDRAGTIAYSHSGYAEGDEHQMEKVLDGLLTTK